MNYLANSVFRSSEIVLLISSLKEAEGNCKSTSLRRIGREESRKIGRECIVRTITEIVNNCSAETHWEDEKDFILFKTHCWIFLSWMNTLLTLNGVSESERFVAINTTFYLEVVKLLNVETFMVKCLCQVKPEVMGILVEDIHDCISDLFEDEDKHLLLEIINCCLKELSNVSTEYIPSKGVENILLLTTGRVKNQNFQLKILEKLVEHFKTLFQNFQEERKDVDIEYSQMIDLLTKKQNLVKFENTVKQFMNDELTGGNLVTKQLKVSSTNQALDSWKQEECVMRKVLLFLTSFIHELITNKWKDLFSWEAQLSGCPVIENSKKCDCHRILFDIFCLCNKSLTKHLKDDVEKAQALLDILNPYLECHASQPEKDIIKEILVQESSDIRNKDTVFQDDVKPIHEKLEEAIFQIEENLVGNEKLFEWLLLTEELYQDERWLKCVVGNAEKYTSTSTAKLLLDVLCVLYQTASQDPKQGNIYKSLQQVILEMVISLSLLEQREVINYNFELICLNFHSSTQHSLFLLPRDDSMLMWTTEMLTVVMNKIVNKAGGSFSHEVLTGVIKGILIAPYVTLKTLLNEAVKNSGCEKVICELLQLMPWLAGLHSSSNDPLLVRALTDILGTLSSKKQEGQYLKLVATLLQSTMHPVLRIEEPALVTASDIMNILIYPLLKPSEKNTNISPTLLLNVLNTTMASSQSSSSQKHWILDEKPLEILLYLFEMLQDCVHFWDDWASDGCGEEPMERDDFALDEAWTEMNVITNLLDKHFIPVLAEDILKEPVMYKNQSSWVENQLNSLDWKVSLLIFPLLNEEGLRCTIKLPKYLVHLVNTIHVRVAVLDDNTEYVESFWTSYFKSCALSNEVCELCLSHLKDGRPQRSDDENHCQEIVDSLTKMLPFSTWLQWERILKIASELLHFRYYNLKEAGWTSDLVGFSEQHCTDSSSDCLINMSALLVTVLYCLSKKAWATSYAWSTTLKNYVSKIKQLSLSVGKQDEFKIRYNFLAHLCYVTFQVIPESFQENIIIVILDLVNTYLSAILPDTSEEQNLDHMKCLKNITTMIPQEELRLTIINKIKRVLDFVE